MNNKAPKPKPSKITRFILLVVGLLVGGWFILVGVSCIGFFYQPSDTSGENVSRADIRRLKTPDNASDISYYYSSNPFGSMYHARYKTTESSVRNFFKEWTWEEIVTPIHVEKNYSIPLYDHAEQERTGINITISNGIFYRELFGNGGGYEAMFDRDTGYFHIERVSH